MCQNSKVAKREKRERGDQRPETTDHKKAKTRDHRPQKGNNSSSE